MQQHGWPLILRTDSPPSRLQTLSSLPQGERAVPLAGYTVTTSFFCQLSWCKQDSYFSFFLISTATTARARLAATLSCLAEVARLLVSGVIACRVLTPCRLFSPVSSIRPRPTRVVGVKAGPVWGIGFDVSETCISPWRWSEGGAARRWSRWVRWSSAGNARSMSGDMRTDRVQWGQPLGVNSIPSLSSPLTPLFPHGFFVLFNIWQLCWNVFHSPGASFFSFCFFFRSSSSQCFFLSSVSPDMIPCGWLG